MITEKLQKVPYNKLPWQTRVIIFILLHCKLRDAPLAWHWLRPVLDDGGRQV